MPSRNANFTFTQGTPTGNQTPTQFLYLTVKDSAGAVVFGPNTMPAGTTGTVVALPVANGYTATLAAHDSAGTPNANPPSVTFNVPPPPPPPAPPDPMLNPPTIS